MRKLLLLVACGSAAHPVAPDHRFDAVDAIVQARVDAGVPGAVVWIQQHGKVIHQAAFGARAASEPMTIDTIFDLESVTKIFTAAAAERLVAAGKLSLDAPAARYLPDLASGATVRDLFRHTGGYDLDLDVSGAPDSATAWKMMLDAPLRTPPGTAVQDSDLGYRIAGRVLEAAAGESLDRLIGKLGFRDTTYGPVHDPRVADAGGSRGVVIDTTDAKLGGVVGCDGLFSTAADVAALAQSVLDGTIPGAKDMATDQTVGMVPADADHDWLRSVYVGPKSIGWEIPTPHAYGAGYGYCKAGISGTFVCVDPPSGLVAVYLTNLGMPAGDDMQPWFTALAPDQVFAAIQRAIGGSLPDPAPAGTSPPRGS